MKAFARTVLGAATVFIAGGIGAAGALASSLTINSVTGIWLNASPFVAGENTPSIRWGTPSGQPDQSGYDFVGTPGAFTVTNENTPFTLGEFTHLNFPIMGTSLDSVDLEVTTDIDGVGLIVTTYSFTHVETPNLPNSASPDPTETCTPGNGELNKQGVNIDGCADIVTAVLNPSATQTFEIGGVEYTLDITGFKVGSNQFTQFFTQETVTNTAQLQAVYRTVVPAPIPLPAAGWMLLAGLGGLGLMRRKQKRDAA